MPVNRLLGIISGDGKVPAIIAEAAKKGGWTIIAVAHTGLTSPDIEKTADTIYRVKLGQLSELINILKKEGVTEAVMAGGVSKRLLFTNFMPDSRALALLS